MSVSYPLIVSPLLLKWFNSCDYKCVTQKQILNISHEILSPVEIAHVLQKQSVSFLSENFPDEPMSF